MQLVLVGPDTRCVLPAPYDDDDGVVEKSVALRDGLEAVVPTCFLFNLSAYPC